MKEIDMERSRRTLIPIPNSRVGSSRNSVFYHFNAVIALLARHYDPAGPWQPTGASSLTDA
jgi:hypothetical protein